MFGFLGDVFSGSGVVDSVEKIALEYIETDKESAEAKSIFVKTLDPNGKMRKQISKDVFHLYKVYIYVSLFLLALEFFGVGNIENIGQVTSKLIDIFVPITAMAGTIISASFGVHYANVKKGV